MSKERVQYLLEQQLHQRLAEDEMGELQLLLDTEEALVLECIAGQIAREGADPFWMDEAQKQALFDKVMQADQLEEDATILAPVIPMSPLLRRWKLIAVCILLSFGAGTVVWLNYGGEKNPVVIIQKEVTPGKDGAILTLADGSKVVLDTIRNSTVALQGGTIAKVVNGMLIYEGGGHEAVFNTMSTPHGRQFHLALPDGTDVWLNSSSSIRYPTSFAAHERRVEVTGEVYFEIARNKLAPFKVSVNGRRAEIEVLGTSFNVNAYDNEKNIATTLVQGKVQVSSGAEAIVLKPGQQARISDHASSSVPDDGKYIRLVNGVDIDKIIAWKDGVFNFDNSSLEEAMRQLERWYAIDIRYTKGIPNMELFGKMSKDVSLNDLLVVLEKLGVHYRLEGRTLWIDP